MIGEDPEFLDLEEALELHRLSLEQYGGGAGVRDLGLLESALAQPRSAFGEHYAHEGLFAMAAAYLFHIARNHPFVDGNKRTALLAALVLARQLGHSVQIAEKHYLGLVRGIPREARTLEAAMQIEDLAAKVIARVSQPGSVPRVALRGTT